jgi:hypothetical protein
LFTFPPTKKKKKKKKRGGREREREREVGLMPIILATQEAEIRRIKV